jgi:molybdopterin adenylyltransferase
VKVSVITISDRAFRGEYEDKSGPEIERLLEEAFPGCVADRSIVPDEAEKILQAFRGSEGSDIILTTGGTGLSARDLTPETTAAYCDREIPGIAEILRAASYLETPAAMLSRGYAGMKGRTIIVNFPGSPAAVRLCVRTLIPVMEHAIAMRDCVSH